jgi:hypothetical protein
MWTLTLSIRMALTLSMALALIHVKDNMTTGLASEVGEEDGYHC